MIADIVVTEKSFGPKELYKGLKFSVQKGEKVGVVGRNGAGKSTLMGIMSGADKDFSGEVIYKRGLIVVATRQEHHGFEHIPVVDYILGDLPEYAELSHIINTYPETMGDDMRKITEYTEALGRFDDLGYYIIEDQILRDLETFQIDNEKARLPLGSLSGGQKRLAEVVKVMHSKSDLALIDEPTNHMDYVAKEQFIDWMNEASEAMLIITHDRDVLECVDSIIEIKDGQANSYTGNYKAYLKQNAHSTTSSLHEYEVTQRKIANLKDKVAQFRRLKEKARDPDTIKQFKRRENEATDELAKLLELDKPTFWIDRDSHENLDYRVGASYSRHKAKNISLQGMSSNGEASKSSRLLVEVNNLSLGYGLVGIGRDLSLQKSAGTDLSLQGEKLFEGVAFQLRENERIELRGRNGAGKSTLIKAILDARNNDKPTTLLSGEIKVDLHVNIGSYEQEINNNYFELSLYDAIERTYLDRNLPVTDQKIRQLLKSYLFEAGDAGVKVAQLSGGQKARLQLISMLANDPQLLILDEPTNHLDLPSIEELEIALEKYSGAVLFVSHDDYFRQKLGAGVVMIGR